MYDNTLTIVLTGDAHGDVHVDDFATVISGFASLISALSKEVAAGSKITWVIEELSTGSARASVVGISDEENAVREVVRAYGIVGSALGEGTPIPYSESVAKAARAITKVLNGRVRAIRFETAKGEAIISAQAGEKKKLRYAIGAVKGTVQTLSCRRGLRFTLYDNIFDQAVSCYLREGTDDVADKMRDVWGKRVIVAGRVGRDPDTGRPVVIRDVTDIIPDEKRPGAHEEAASIIPFEEGDEMPEEAIRRVRDAIRNPDTGDT